MHCHLCVGARKHMSEKKDIEMIMKKRHSLAHLLAAAVIKHFPDAHLTIGPATETGFYYDVDFGDADFSDKLLPKIQKTMRKTLSSWHEFEGKTISPDEARELFAGNTYKLELIEGIIEKGEDITVYTSGNFTDLCRGGHVDDMAKDIAKGSFALDRIAGAYWRGNENNPMLTRIYGLAFDTAEELDEYLNQREEAQKRDHKKIGQELGLFAFSERVGRGLPLFLPKGAILKTTLADYITSEKAKRGYVFVDTPHIAKRALYETSGHMGKYDAMMPVMTDKHGEEFVMKAMNCPHHFEIYNSQMHSYKDLPLRIAENGMVYRNEKSGELSGLLRVRALTQDDTHHIIREDQIESEIDMILDFMKSIYKDFDFKEFKVGISVRDPKDHTKYFGDDALWEKAEAQLVASAKKHKFDYTVDEDEAAFYGPKIDVRVKDAIGREWQLTTVQLDFNQPENFDMTYVGQDGSPHRVVILHVALLGSIERFLGVVIEHYAGRFPLWLSPVQIAVLPISDEKHGAYTKEITDKLTTAGIRAEHHDMSESLGKRIRNARTQRIPYLVIAGDQEMENSTVTLEGRDGFKLEGITFEKLMEHLNNEIEEKS